MTLPCPWHTDAQERRPKTAPELLDGLELIELFDRAYPGKLAGEFRRERPMTPSMKDLEDLADWKERLQGKIERGHWCLNLLLSMGSTGKNSLR